MPTIALANQKGGVGKSSTVLNLSAALAKESHRVLLIDAGPQADATTAALGFAEQRYSTYDVLKGDVDIKSTIVRADGLGVDILASDIELAGYEQDNLMGAQTRLRKALATIEADYDYVLIDSPPNLGLLTVNALAASDRVIIPTDCSLFGLKAIARLMETVEQVREHLDAPELKISGILITLKERTVIARDVEAQLRQQYGGLVFDTTIPKNVSINEAHGHQLSVIDHDPISAGALAYLKLTQEVINRG